MREEIKIKERQERTLYVPASVKVIELTSQRVLCLSETETSDAFDQIQ